MARKIMMRMDAGISPADVWTIAQQCVLAAGGSLNGQSPDPYAPLNHWILDEDSLVKYYGILQNMLVNRGFNVGVDTDPPMSYDDIDGGDFLDMIRAVDKRMLGE